MNTNITMARGRRPRLAAALAAIARGWPVFPVHPFSKVPAIDDWGNHATCDPDTVAAWWNSAPFNVGIACGPAGLVVIDLDADGQNPPPDWAAHGVTHGRDVLTVLAERQGVTPPTDTYTVATPTGGEHHYFLAPSDRRIRTTSGELGWHIDTRAAGGAIIAAGSGRRINGRARLYRVANNAPVAPLPAWLAGMLAWTPQPAPTPRHIDGDRIDAYARAAVAGESRNVANASTGARNQTLFKAAARLGELVGAGLLAEATAACALREAASVHIGVDRFTAAEVDRTIASGLARGRQRPRRLSAGSASLT